MMNFLLGLSFLTIVCTIAALVSNVSTIEQDIKRIRSLLDVAETIENYLKIFKELERLQQRCWREDDHILYRKLHRDVNSVFMEFVKQKYNEEAY